MTQTILGSRLRKQNLKRTAYRKLPLSPAGSDPNVNLEADSTSSFAFGFGWSRKCIFREKFMFHRNFREAAILAFMNNLKTFFASHRWLSTCLQGREIRAPAKGGGGHDARVQVKGSGRMCASEGGQAACVKRGVTTHAYRGRGWQSVLTLCVKVWISIPGFSFPDNFESRTYQHHTSTD